MERHIDALYPNAYIRTVYVNPFSSSRFHHPDSQSMVWSAAIVTRGVGIVAVAGIQKDARKGARKGVRKRLFVKGSRRGVRKKKKKCIYIYVRIKIYLFLKLKNI